MIKNYKKTLITISLLTSIVLCSSTIAAPHTDTNTHNIVHKKHSEAAYQHAWCNLHGGITEYRNPDRTRIDCLTATHAVEFDFAKKWAEGVGQALYYALLTGKRPMVVLILDDPDTQMRYVNRVKKIASVYNLDVSYVTNDILKLDSFGNCNYVKCKCHNLN